MGVPALTVPVQGNRRRAQAGVPTMVLPLAPGGPRTRDRQPFLLACDLV